MPNPKVQKRKTTGIRQRGNGWEWNVRINGRLITGTCGTKTEAVAARAEAQAASNKNAFVAPAKVTVSEFVASWWPNYSAGLRPTTQRTNWQLIRDHILPHLGAVPIQKLDAAALERLYAKLRKSGRVDGKGGLTDTGVAHVHQMIHRILVAAVKAGIVVRNVADLVDTTPSRNETQAGYWTAEQVGAFLAATVDRRQQPLWAFVAATGLRRGELAGLRWRDVDLDAGVIVVCNNRVVADGGIHEHSPKSKKGAAKTRVVPIGPATVANLKRWRTQVTKERLAAGEGWVDSGYVAVDPAGQPMHPEALSTSFNRAVRAVAPSLRLPRIHFHELRHSAAVVLWAAGTQTELIAERLGHADAGITRKVYLHVPRQLHDEAAVAADRALFGG